MRLVDTHTHLQDGRFDEDRSDVVAKALETLEWVIVIGDDLETSQRAVDMAGPRCFATVGLHPHHAQHATPDAMSTLRELCTRPSVVALGEIGLDYHYDFSPREAQRDVFAEQLGIAVENRLPVVVHCREAEEHVAAILEPVHASLSGGIMHCFGGDAAFAQQCIDWGFYVSFAGNVTFRNAEQLRQAAAIVPMDRLLVETDCPYLAPQPVRGRRCEPIHVLHTAARLAEVKGVPLEELTIQTTENACRAFGIALADDGQAGPGQPLRG